MVLLCMTVKRSKEALMSMALACISLFMKSTKGFCITPQALLQRETTLDSSNAMENNRLIAQWQLENIKHGSTAVYQWSLHLLDNYFACNLAIQQCTIQQLWGLYYGIFPHLCTQWGLYCGIFSKVRTHQTNKREK